MSLERMTKLSWIYDLYHLGQNELQQGNTANIYQRILLHIVAGFDAKSGSLSLHESGGDDLTIVAGIDLPTGVIGSKVKMGAGVLGWVVKEGKALLMNGDITSDPRFQFRSREGRAPAAANSAICWPLQIEDRIIGGISVNRPDVIQPFTSDDLEQGTTLLKMVSLALSNVQLHIEQNRQLEKLQQMNLQLEEAHRAFEQTQYELQVSVSVMKMAQAEMIQAEADKDQQMNALAEANVRMVLFHSTMEELRQISTCITEIGDHFSYKVLRDAISLTGAKYGAMGLFDETGKLGKFLTEGISEAERQKIGPYPVGKGLLHAFYKESKITRVGSIADDTRSCGFPPGHPPMTSLLGVPIVVNGITKGVIYLTDKQGGEPFSESDEMYMDLLSAEVMHMLERTELMQSLNKSNQALILEKAEQQKLITQLQDAQSHLLQSDKMASIGQLAAGVAHEINNPIGFVYSNLGTLNKYVQDLFGMLDKYEQAETAIPEAEIRTQLQSARKKLDIAFLKEDLGALMAESKDGITRVKNIVQNLKDFSHVDAADEWKYADLHEGIDSTLNIVNNEIKYKAEVVKEYGDIPQVECLPSQLNQVFMNLLVNASHAIEERGLITVRTGQTGEEAWVEIADTGKGIAAENLQKIFDPFFTTKPIGKGTGLGLSLSYGIIQKHNGRIEVQSEIGKGTTFRIWLPLRHVPQD